MKPLIAWASATASAVLAVMAAFDPANYFEGRTDYLVFAGSEFRYEIAALLVAVSFAALLSRSQSLKQSAARILCAAFVPARGRVSAVFAWILMSYLPFGFELLVTVPAILYEFSLAARARFVYATELVAREYRHSLIRRAVIADQVGRSTDAVVFYNRVIELAGQAGPNDWIEERLDTIERVETLSRSLLEAAQRSTRRGGIEPASLEYLLGALNLRPDDEVAYNTLERWLSTIQGALDNAEAIASACKGEGRAVGGATRTDGLEYYLAWGARVGERAVRRFDMRAQDQGSWRRPVTPGGAGGR